MSGPETSLALAALWSRNFGETVHWICVMGSRDGARLVALAKSFPSSELLAFDSIDDIAVASRR